MPGERFEAFVREELDKLGNSQPRGVAVERVHQADAGRAFRVLQSEVDGGRATGIVADRDDLLEPHPRPLPDPEAVVQSCNARPPVCLTPRSLGSLSKWFCARPTSGVE